MQSLSKILLIAPCGMNCGICRAYLRNKNKYKVGLERVLIGCPGCRGTNTGKPVYCVGCKIENCRIFRKDGAKYCYECEDFPCNVLKHLDKRYRTKYNMSMVENLEYIRDHGIRKFIKNEDIKWTCKKCGGKICVHKGYCVDCSGKR